MDIHAGVNEHILMQKLKKKLKLKNYRRLRNLFKDNKTKINTVLLLSQRKRPKFLFIVKSTQNNVFCTLKNFRNNKIFLNTSSGKEKIHISRKTLIFGSKQILLSFLKKIKKKIKGSKILINITAPLRIKIILLRLIKNFIQHSYIYINTNHKKCFNGCKPPKKKRKKQRGLRVFK